MDGKELQRSLALFRRDYPASAVEKVEWVDHFPSRNSGGRAFTGRKHDLFGFADVLVTGPDSGTIAIQVTTSRAQMLARLRKIKGKRQPNESAEAAFKRRENVIACLLAGWRIMIQGWNQPGDKGTRWNHSEIEVTLEEMEA